MGSMTSPASDSLSDIWDRLDERVRRVDEERWLSSRYAPTAERRGLITLYAFYYELARVRVSVSDPTLGQIRFQWWREAIDELAQGKQRQHDVVTALADEIHARRLDPDRLQALVNQFEAAFLAADRAMEPENALAQIAVQLVSTLNSPPAFDARIASEWASLRRGEQVAEPRPRIRVDASVRPALAHFRLRRAWRRSGAAGRLRTRLSIMMAVLTGWV